MTITIRKVSSWKEWDRILNRLGEGDYRQTWEYGEALIKSGKANEVVRLSASGVSNGALGALQIVRRGSIIGGEILSGGSSGGGPILSEAAGDQLAERIILSMVQISRRLMCGKVRLHVFDDKSLDPVLRSISFRKVSSAKIFFVNLDRDVEDLWRAFEGNKRRNIRKAEEFSIKVEQSQRNQDMAEFYNMYREFSRLRGFIPPSFKEMKCLWDSLKSHHRTRIFLAKKGEKTVATAFVINHLGTIFCPFTCSNQIGRETRANDILHWKVIKWGSERRMDRYNMGQVYTDPDSKQYGVFRWKRAFGGYTRKMSIYENIVNSWLNSFKEIAKELFTEGK